MSRRGFVLRQRFKVPVIPGNFAATAHSMRLPRSTDTLESLLATEEPMSYARLAEWLATLPADARGEVRNHLKK